MQPVPQQHRPLTSMESPQLVRMMAKVDHGPIRSTSLKVNVKQRAAFDLVKHERLKVILYHTLIGGDIFI